MAERRRWTDEVLPAGTETVQALWAVPTGEVFVVGTGGLIVKGP